MIITKVDEEKYKVELEGIDLNKVDHIFDEMFRRNAGKINKHTAHLKKRDILANIIVDEILSKLDTLDKISVSVSGIHDFTMYIMSSDNDSINGVVFSFE